MSTAGAPLEVEQRQRLRWLWLNRPGLRNALDEALLDALAGALGDAEADAGTDVLVIAGRGASFCAGADLRTLLGFADVGRSPLGFLSRVSATFTRLERGPLPVVAAVHGHAVAGGLELALAADLVVAADSALIGDGHLRNELLPAGGSSLRLPRKVGAGRARWLLLSGELERASWFDEGTWPHAVVPEPELYATAERLGGQLARAAGPGQSRLKRLLAEVEDEPPAAALRRELKVFGEHWEAAAIAERLRAFFASQRAQAGARSSGQGASR